MRINDFAMYINSVFSSLLKTVRIDIDEAGKKEIIKNGLYHITMSEEVTRKIIESEHLRPSTGITKNINSYGTACVCLFNGTPDINNYIKNLVDYDSKKNPYVNPTIAVSAVKISPTEIDELANYKARSLVDDVIIYEGYCILPKEKVQAVYLVPDLVRDSKTGEPIINSETGKYDIKFREALPEELEQDKKSYKAKEDYLQFIEQEKERLKYSKGENIVSNTYNSVRSAMHETKLEGQFVQKNAFQKISELIKRKINQFRTPKLEMGTDEKISSSINEFKHDKKNPYRDKKFGQAVASFQAEGLEQLKLKEELEKITTSSLGAYFRNKYNQIDKNLIVKRGIHNINHNNRVAIHSLIIAQREGILENDDDDKTKDILLSAAYYHDIGRKKGVITDNFGPHSKLSARKLREANLKYVNGENYSLEDRRILQAIVEAHEGKDKDMLKVCKKYKVSKEKLDYTMNLMAIIKDADALDRARLDLNSPVAMITDLNPKFLRTKTSKQLLNASYELESLSKKIPFDRILSYKTNEQTEIPKSKIEDKRDEFVDYLRRGVNKMPQIIEKTKKHLSLKKEKYTSKFVGNNVLNKIKNILRSRREKESSEYEIEL